VNIRGRLNKLEIKIGKTPDKHYVLVIGDEGESSEAAVTRTLQEKGISEQDIGRMFVVGRDYVYTEDHGGYDDWKELQGWREAEDFFKQVLSKLSGSSLGVTEEVQSDARI
jgi:hypothetical protein